MSHIANGQRLIVVGFFDTNDTSIGNGCAVDKNNFRKQYQRLGRALALPVSKYEFDGDDFTENNFDNFDKLFSTTKDDVILFYTSCHGARSIYDRTKYPQIVINGNYKSVYNKYQKLKAAPHKSLFTIIDACNVEKDIEPAEIELFSKLYKPVLGNEIPGIEKANAKALFLEKKFDAIVTSSQPGVKSITTTAAGSIFTNCLLYSLNYYLNVGDARLVNIDNVLQKTYRQTNDETTRMYTNNPKNLRNKEEQPQKPDWEIINKAAASEGNIIDKTEKRYEIVYKKEKLSALERLRYHNDYRVVLKIKNNNKQVDDIKQVKYFFHPDTFKEPVVTATDRARDFRYTILIWGEFLVKAEITLDDGTVVDIAKYLDL
ncbi:MAG: pYEATS domain-containing protein [Janthinobacterium lividum]